MWKHFHKLTNIRQSGRKLFFIIILYTRYFLRIFSREITRKQAFASISNYLSNIEKQYLYVHLYF